MNLSNKDYKDEYKFSYHLPKTDNRRDCHITKVVRHHSDGRREHRLETIVDFERPFWVTKKIYRNHKQPKECEHVDKLKRVTCTQSELPYKIFQEEGMRRFNKTQLYDVYKAPFAPYVYGASVNSEVFINLSYKDKCDIITPMLVGVLDIENDVDTGEITLISFTRLDYDNNITSNVFINDNFLEKPIHELRNKVIANLRQSLPEEIAGIQMANVNLEVTKTDNELSLILQTFELVHTTDIDILTGWNFLYDVEMISNALYRNHGIDPADVFSHPSIPNEFKHFEIKKAAETRTTQAGEVKNVPFEERWHIMKSSAKFYMIDNMAAFVHLRKQDTKLHGGFGLNNVLDKLIGFGKLKQDEYENLTSMAWHRTVAKEKPIDYISYNIYDTLGETILETRTNDLSISLPLLCGVSPLNNFKSGPSLIYNDMFVFYAKDDLIVGNLRNIKTMPKTLGRTDWVVTVNLWKADDTFATNIAIEDTGQDGADTLINHLRGVGYNIPNKILKSKVYADTLDLDKEAAYPTGAYVLNISSDTVTYELLSVEGIDRSIFMRANISLISGVISAHNYVTTMHNMPTLDEFDLFIQKEMKQ